MKKINRRRRLIHKKPRRFPTPPKKSKVFDPSVLINQPQITQPIQIAEIKHRFADFNINPTLQKNISKLGYITPTPIQDQIIPHILQGKDVIGLANTGTGKTAAFLIPLIEKIHQNKSARALIVTPTRELATQIQSDLKALTHKLNIHSALCIGGVSIKPQVKVLKTDPQFIIGTPGRLKDLYQQQYLRFSQLNIIVLDEVDQMLDMGFIGDVKYIVKLLSRPRHSLFFSATMPDKITGIMHSFLTNPVTVSVAVKDTLDNIDQQVIKVAGKNKLDILEELLRDPDFSKVIIFGRTKRKLNKLERMLQSDGFSVSAIHGNKSQSKRERVLRDFKKNRLQALLATDVISRGIDIESVTHVINFDMPQSYEEYIHRIGRTGRASKSGMAITFVD